MEMVFYATQRFLSVGKFKTLSVSLIKWNWKRSKPFCKLRHVEHQSWRDLEKSQVHLWVKELGGEALSLVTLWRELHAFTIHSIFIVMVVGRKWPSCPLQDNSEVIFQGLTQRMGIVHHLPHSEQRACRFLGKELSLPSEFDVSKQYN